MKIVSGWDRRTVPIISEVLWDALHRHHQLSTETLLAQNEKSSSVCVTSSPGMGLEAALVGAFLGPLGP